MQSLPSKWFSNEVPALLSNLLSESTNAIPGCVYYSIKRFEKPANWMADEAAVLKYHVEPSNPKNNYLELRYCVIGNMYCKTLQDDCNQCKLHQSVNCDQRIESVDLVSFVFSSTLLEQFVRSRIEDTSINENVLSFTYSSSFTRSLALCGRTRSVIEGILNQQYSGSLQNIYVNAQTQMLLLYSLDSIGGKEIDVISCKFLNNEQDREKIVKARQLLVEHIGEPITIKQLSRKVAMNECYLKKGFKEMFGTTIFEFYQSQRMEHAKYLLYEKGLTVTDVSSLLGYSSISHFSTAFKKHTGLKPCELLFR
jgi:AraC family transcriptional regulator